MLKRPLTGVYLSFFLMVTLLILVGATWMGLYLAKRITRPVQMLAAAAREIGAGRLDQRVEPQSNDEFGALVEAFNAMAGELATSRRKVERSTIELERKHLEVEAAAPLHRDDPRAHHDRRRVGRRRRARSRRSTARRARLLEPRSRRSSASRPRRCSTAPICSRSARCSPARAAAQTEPAAQEIAMPRDGQELHLAAVATPLVGDSGAPEGAVLVLDDVTPLIRAQKVAAWREVARRLAHEIKNPLTPIQLSRRAAAAPLRRRAAGAQRAGRRVHDARSSARSSR